MTAQEAEDINEALIAGLSKPRRDNQRSAFRKVLYGKRTLAGAAGWLDYMAALHPGLSGVALIEAVTFQELDDYLALITTRLRAASAGGRLRSGERDAISDINDAIKRFRDRASNASMPVPRRGRGRGRG